MSENRSPGGRRVLVAEDELLIAMDLERTLADLGCEVVGPAASVARATELAATEPIDGAILDIDLGGESTLALAASLRARGVPVLLATGHPARGTPATGPDALPRIVKPYDRAAVEAALRQLFGPG